MELTEDLDKSRKFEKWRVSLSRIKRKVLSHVWLARIALILFTLVFLFGLSLAVINLITKSRLGYYTSLASDFIFAPLSKTQNINGRINFLILGKAGEDNDAPELTDTIIFVSLNPIKNSLTLVSLPRDIWIPELRAKFNSTYYWGNLKKPPVQRSGVPKEAGGGLILTKSITEEIVGQKVQYGVVIDFAGFKKIIDNLGGITVRVDNSFIDEKYPISGKENDACQGDPEFKCRYETLRFNQGEQNMDGEISLKFARSRNAEGPEGTDFARAARQQKVIDAVKDKVLNTDFLLSPKKIMAMKDIILRYVETDINTDTAAVLAHRIFNARNNIKNYVLPENLLINPPKSEKYDNLYVFIPTNAGWNKVREWINSVLN